MEERNEYVAAIDEPTPPKTIGNVVYGIDFRRR
jgi:hypothetical protein